MSTQAQAQAHSAARSAKFIPGEALPTRSPVPTIRSRPTALSDEWFWGLGCATREVSANIRLAARSHTNVLIIGETGTGKELVAKAIHSARKKEQSINDIEAPFVPVNCGALPEALAESLLFGHERGAFTSARERQHGKFETARRGTLFLDEIQTLSPSIQIKLLRVIQHREFERLGAKSFSSVDCQVIAATNIPLELLVDRRQFRRDLYYRLNVCPIYLPSLRHRKEDLPILCDGLLKRVSAQHRVSTKTLSAESFELIQNYNWPGNIRQLEHALLYASLRCGPVIEAEHLPGFLTGQLESYLACGAWDA